MLSVKQIGRRQAVSAGLVAGTFFSSACADEERVGSQGPDADLSENSYAPLHLLIDANEPGLAELPGRARRIEVVELHESAPIVTPLALENIEPAPVETSLSVSTENEPSVRTRPSPRARPPVHAPAAKVPARPTLVLESYGSRSEPSSLDRQPMLGDSYAAFGANGFY